MNKSAAADGRSGGRPRNSGSSFDHGLSTLDQKVRSGDHCRGRRGHEGTPDVAGKVFGALGRHNINISAIAQGASERNISCVVDAAQQSRALNVIHQGFFETRKSLGARGCRRRQHRRRAAATAVRATAVPARAGVRRQSDRRRQQQAVRHQARRHRPRPMARGARLPPTGAWIRARWRTRLPAWSSRTPRSSTAPLNRPSSTPIRSSSRRTCTSSRRTSARTCCRGDATRPCGSCWPSHQKHFLYETNVGAGLPIISTLRDLIVSGDVITKVEGMSLGNAQLPVQHVRRHGALQHAGSRSAPDGLHRARSS